MTFNKVLEVTPTDFKLLKLVVELYEEMGEHDHAESIWQSCKPHSNQVSDLPTDQNESRLQQDILVEPEVDPNGELLLFRADAIRLPRPTKKAAANLDVANLFKKKAEHVYLNYRKLKSLEVNVVNPTVREDYLKTCKKIMPRFESKLIKPVVLSLDPDAMAIGDEPELLTLQEWFDIFAKVPNFLI